MEVGLIGAVTVILCRFRSGFRVVTARKKGSHVIHSTIMNGLLDADLAVADLTEHQSQRALRIRDANGRG
jgi:hypothetical protein